MSAGKRNMSEFKRERLRKAYEDGTSLFALKERFDMQAYTITEMAKSYGWDEDLRKRNIDDDDD